MKTLSHILCMLSFAIITAHTGVAIAKEIYRCASQDIPQSVTDNPNGLTSVSVSVIELKQKIAGRPVLLVEGKYEYDKVTTEFSLSVLGIPEFIGPNMFHAYFTAAYTTNNGQKPSNLFLRSNFSKMGSSRALLTIDNSSHAIPGADEKLFLKDVPVSCTQLTNFKK